MGRKVIKGTIAWLLGLPPEERLQLIGALREGRVYGTKFLNAMETKAMGEIERARREACSMSRINDFRHRGLAYREPRMRLSRFGSRVGNRPGVLETQRYTPPQSVVLEDRYDAMDAIEAAACNDPPSVTGIQFQQIALRRGRIEKPRPAKKKKGNAATPRDA